MYLPCLLAKSEPVSVNLASQIVNLGAQCVWFKTLSCVRGYFIFKWLGSIRKDILRKENSFMWFLAITECVKLDKKCKHYVLWLYVQNRTYDSHGKFAVFLSDSVLLTCL